MNGRLSKYFFLKICSSGGKQIIHKVSAASIVKNCHPRTSLMLFTHVGFFSKTRSDTFRSVLIYGKEQEPRKKYFRTVQDNSSSREGLTVGTRFFYVEKSNSNRSFLNDSKYKTITRE